MSLTVGMKIVCDVWPAANVTVPEKVWLSVTAEGWVVYCTLTGKADRNDWITVCPAQETVYSQVLAIIGQVEKME